VSLVARHLEANGIPTVILGCALDIVEYCGVPRFVFSNFPLGNSAGKPFDVASQAATLELAFRLMETAVAPRTTLWSPQRWSDDPSWKRDYNNVERLSPADIAELRREFDQLKETARQLPGRRREAGSV
jgi:D-proline reductase (dithiol) PrdB